MTNITIGLEKTEGEILAFKISDEALEIAAGEGEGELYPRGLYRPV